MEGKTLKNEQSTVDEIHVYEIKRTVACKNKNMS